MPHDARTKRTPDEPKAPHSSIPARQSRTPELATRNLANDRRRSGVRTPFYSVPDHFTHGWQQRLAFRDISNGVGGTGNDPSLSSTGSRTWPVQQRDSDDAEPSGFNPVTIRQKRIDERSAKARSTLEYVRRLRAEQESKGVTLEDSGYGLVVSATVESNQIKDVSLPVGKASGTESPQMEGHLSAVTEQISPLTVQPDPRLEHQNAVPKPLDLAATEAAEQKQKLVETQQEWNLRDVKGGERTGSFESLATDMSSEFETVSIPDSSEHNGARRKWYKGFRRSE